MERPNRTFWPTQYFDKYTSKVTYEPGFELRILEFLGVPAQNVAELDPFSSNLRLLYAPSTPQTPWPECTHTPYE